MSHEVNLLDAATATGLLGIILRDGWRWLRPNGNGATAIQVARLEERIGAIVDRLERIETKLDLMR